MNWPAITMAYIAACLAWGIYLERGVKTLHNWQRLISYSVFLPLVIAACLLVAFYELWKWLMEETR